MINKYITLLSLLLFAHTAWAQLTVDSRQVSAIVSVSSPANGDVPKTRVVPMRDLMREEEPSLLHARQQLYTYQPRHYGFFCKVESKIEKKSGISPRFRLGSTEYVDGLEGKYLIDN